MAELVDRFAGKVSGELIRAADWNGLIAAVEEQFAALESRFGDRIADLEGRIGGAETHITEVENDLGPLVRLADALRDRYRRIDLSATRTTPRQAGVRRARRWPVILAVLIVVALVVAILAGVIDLGL